MNQEQNNYNNQFNNEQNNNVNYNQVPPVDLLGNPNTNNNAMNQNYNTQYNQNLMNNTQNYNMQYTQSPLNNTQNYNTQYTPNTVNQNNSNTTLNSNKQKNSKGGIIIFIIIIVLIAGGIFMFKDKLFGGTSVFNGGSKVYEKKDAVYINYNESRETDNLAVPLRWGKGHYVIKFNGEGFGTAPEKKYGKVQDSSTYYLDNGKFKILSYFDAKSEPSLRLFGLFGFEYMEVNMELYKPQFIEGTNEYSTYKVIKNVDNNYLVSNYWNSDPTRITYYIKMVLSDEDVIKVYLTSNISQETAESIFDSFITNTEVCYVPWDDNGNHLQAVKYDGSSENVDISRWTFIQSLLSDMYKEKGIRIKNTSYIEIFNSTAYQSGCSNAIYYYPAFEHRNETMKVGLVIREIDEETFEKIADETKRTESDNKYYKNIKELELDSFKKAYISEIAKYEGTIFVKTDKDIYFSFTTGLPYRNGSPTDLADAQEIINEIFN